MAAAGRRLPGRRRLRRPGTRSSTAGAWRDRACRSLVFLRQHRRCRCARGVAGRRRSVGRRRRSSGRRPRRRRATTSAGSRRSAPTRRCSTCARRRGAMTRAVACAGSCGAPCCCSGASSSLSWSGASALQAAPLLLAGAGGLVIAALAARAASWIRGAGGRRPRLLAAGGPRRSRCWGSWPGCGYADRRGGGAGRDRDGAEAVIAAAAPARRSPVTIADGGPCSPWRCPASTMHLTGADGRTAAAGDVAGARRCSRRSSPCPPPASGAAPSLAAFARGRRACFHLPGLLRFAVVRPWAHGIARPSCWPPPSRSTGR